MNIDKYFKEYEGIEAFSVQQINFMLQLPCDIHTDAYGHLKFAIR